MSIIRRIKISNLLNIELSEEDKLIIKKFNNIFVNTYTKMFIEAPLLNIFDKNDDRALFSLYKNEFGFWCYVREEYMRNILITDNYYNELFQYKYNIKNFINFIHQGNLSLVWLDDLNEKFL